MDPQVEQVLINLLRDPEAFARNYQRNPPDFLYNNPDICCLLHNTDPNNSICLGTNQGYLGKKGKIGIPYLVEIEGQTFILKTTQPGRLSLVYRERPPSNVQKFQQKLLQSPSRCGYSDMQNYKFLGGDEFTNEMLVGFILDAYFTLRHQDNGNSTRFYPYITYYLSSVCNDTQRGLILTSQRLIGVHLIEYANLGTLWDFSRSNNSQEYRIVHRDPIDNIQLEILRPEITALILRQVISALHILQNELQFNHGDLKLENIFVSSEPSQGDYEGLDVTAPFTCKIADYGKSSLTVESVQTSFCRIYNRSWLADRYLYLVPFNPMVNIDRIGEQEEPYFIIQGFLDVQLYTQTRHMGLPFYLAYDTYSFLVSMLLNPTFYYSFFSQDVFITQLWNPMWFGNDARRMQHKIKSQHHNARAQSTGLVLDLLRGIRLRCNGTQVLLDNLKLVHF